MGSPVSPITEENDARPIARALAAFGFQPCQSFRECHLPCSRAATRASSSVVSSVRRYVSTSAIRCAPSVGVSSPAATASSTAPAAFAASRAVSILGKVNCTGASRLGGAMRSRQSRSAVVSPARAISTALRVNAPASPVQERQRRLCGLVTRTTGLAGVAGGKASSRIAPRFYGLSYRCPFNFGFQLPPPPATIATIATNCRRAGPMSRLSRLSQCRKGRAFILHLGDCPLSAMLPPAQSRAPRFPRPAGQAIHAFRELPAQPRAFGLSRSELESDSKLSR
ncbi:MAG: hypothetical protein KatS3mg120_2630 [Erythrobacter sp.]|nr:MAG: hypothetical protein KatS3mg120_2630 [Erythrobacter sp.]